MKDLERVPPPKFRPRWFHLALPAAFAFAVAANVFVADLRLDSIGEEVETIKTFADGIVRTPRDSYFCAPDQQLSIPLNDGEEIGWRIDWLGESPVSDVDRRDHGVEFLCVKQGVVHGTVERDGRSERTFTVVIGAPTEEKFYTFETDRVRACLGSIETELTPVVLVDPRGKIIRVRWESTGLSASQKSCVEDFLLEQTFDPAPRGGARVGRLEIVLGEDANVVLIQL